MIDKELVKAFVQECKDIQDWENIYKSNHIEIEDFFKPSGKTEKDNQDYAKLIKKANQIKAIKTPIKSRKKYHKNYWLNNKK